MSVPMYQAVSGSLISMNVGKKRVTRLVSCVVIAPKFFKHQAGLNRV